MWAFLWKEVKLMRKVRGRLLALAGGVAGGLAVVAGSAGAAMAEGIKYAEIVTPAKTEFEAAVTAVLPFVGLVLGVLVGIMIVKRLARSK
jgi:hypothetical protein